MTFMRKIDKDLLDEIDAFISKAYSHGDRVIFTPHEYVDEYEEYMAKKMLYMSWRQVLALLESNGLLVLLDEAKKEYASFKKAPLDSAMGPEEPYLIWPSKVREYLEVLRSLYIEPSKVDTEEYRSLRNILSNCEVFITDRQIFPWFPCKEDDVHDRIEAMLKCHFPELKRKPVLTKPIKNFIPDTGIKSLKTLIEYKYIDNKEYGKEVYDTILTDVSGYQCSDYESIIFVIYETERYFPESDWKAAIKGLKAKMRLEVILLKGTPPQNEDRETKKDNEAKLAKRKKKIPEKKLAKKRVPRRHK